MSSNEDYDSDFEAAAEKALALLLPEKSKEKYEKSYEAFKKWCNEKKIKTVDDKTMLVYFSTELNNYSAATSWSQYSMLKATLAVKESINMKDFHMVRAFLKRKGEGYIAKKSKICTIEQMYRFLKEAPDDKFLAVKVALIVGVYGACRRTELKNMTIDDFEFMENGIKVDVPITKTKNVRQFVIGEGCDPEINLIEIIKRYVALRPATNGFTRFLICYRNGKCTRQPIGINTIAAFPNQIATFLGLQFANKYTGHCFRRSSSSLLSDSGANITTIKKHCGWRSDAVAEGYIEHSLNNKRKIAGNIFGVKIPKTNEVSRAVAIDNVNAIMEDSIDEIPTSSDGVLPAKHNPAAVESVAAVDSVQCVIAKGSGSDENVTIISTQSKSSVLLGETSSNTAKGFDLRGANLTNCNFYFNNPTNP